MESIIRMSFSIWQGIFLNHYHPYEYCETNRRARNI